MLSERTSHLIQETEGGGEFSIQNMLEIKIHKSSYFSAPLIKAVTVDNLVPPNKSGSQFQRLQLNESKYYFTVLLGKLL